MKTKSDTKKGENRELHKTIQEKINEGVRSYHDELVQTAMENRNGFMRVKVTLIINKQQIVVVTQDRTTTGNVIIKIVNKFCSELYETPDSFENTLTNNTSIDKGKDKLSSSQKK